MELLKKTLKAIQTALEIVWQATVIIWNFPIAIVELLWTFCFNRERFNYNWNLLKESIKTGKSFRP